MKQIEATLLTHLAQEVTTYCFLVRVACQGPFAGEVYGFTNNDVDRTYDDGDGSLLYRSDNGFTPARMQHTSGINVDNSELEGAISDDGITEARVRAGLFDNAQVTIYRVNYEDLTSGRHEVVDFGKAGETVFDEITWRTEFRSLSQLLKQPITPVYSLTCRAQFGDAQCGKSFVWVAGEVEAVGAENDRLFTDSSLGEADDHFAPGVVRWLTGDNADNEMDVDSYGGDDIALALGMPYPIQVGDTYEIRQDCNKRDRLRGSVPGDCKDKHDNLVNFRGEPDIPVDGTAMVPGAEIRRDD